MGSLRPFIGLALVFLFLDAYRVPLATAAGGRHPRSGCATSYASMFGSDADRLELLPRMQQGDTDAWDRFLGVALEKGMRASEIGEIRAAARGLSPDGARWVTERIARSYRSLGQRDGSAYFAPKRVADIVLSAVLRPEQHFDRAVNGLDSSAGALRAYFRQVREHLSAQEQGSGDFLDMEDLEIVAREFQRELRTRGSFGESAAVTLFGSLPNGRAVPGKSDVDFIYTGSRMPEAEILNTINQKLGARNRAGIAGLDGSSDQDLKASWMSVVNPIQLEITAERVDIVVYPAPARPFRAPYVLRWF